jgi:hypothetical protein
VIQALEFSSAATATAKPSAADAAIPQTASPYDALPESVRLVMDRPFTGDFDAMVKRRAIRVAVTFNRTHYFIDKGQEPGPTCESLKLFENDLNTDGWATSSVSPRSGSAGKRSPASATSYKYYITYHLLSDQRARREAAKAAVGKRN